MNDFFLIIQCSWQLYRHQVQNMDHRFEKREKRICTVFFFNILDNCPSQVLYCYHIWETVASSSCKGRVSYCDITVTIFLTKSSYRRKGLFWVRDWQKSVHNLFYLCAWAEYPGIRNRWQRNLCISRQTRKKKMWQEGARDNITLYDPILPLRSRPLCVHNLYK